MFFALGNSIVGVFWLLQTLGAEAKPTEFLLDTDTPDALCPELRMTREAVATRLGKLEVEGGGTWRGRYSMVHDPAGHRGDYVRLVIVDPSGHEQAIRELPIGKESCVTMASAIALVVDGYFRDLGQTPGRETDSLAATAPPLPSAAASTTDRDRVTQPQPPQGRAATAPPTADPSAATRSQPAEDRSQSARAAIPRRTKTADSGHNTGFQLGVGFESVPSSLALSYGWFFAITDAWRVDITARFPTARVNEAYGSAIAHVYPIPLRLSVPLLLRLSPDWRWFIGPELLVSLEHGSVDGVAQKRSGLRASFGVGARLGVARWVSSHFAVAANFSADEVLVQSRRFLMANDPALELPRARMAGTLELWGILFP